MLLKCQLASDGSSTICQSFSFCSALVLFGTAAAGFLTCLTCYSAFAVLCAVNSDGTSCTCGHALPEVNDCEHSKA